MKCRQAQPGSADADGHSRSVRVEAMPAGGAHPLFKYIVNHVAILPRRRRRQPPAPPGRDTRPVDGPYEWRPHDDMMHRSSDKAQLAVCQSLPNGTLRSGLDPDAHLNAAVPSEPAASPLRSSQRPASRDSNE